MFAELIIVLDFSSVVRCVLDASGSVSCIGASANRLGLNYEGNSIFLEFKNIRYYFLNILKH